MKGDGKFPIRMLAVYLTCISILSVLPVNTKGELNHITILKLRGDYFLIDHG